jgi:hypothetical protein
VAAGIRTVNTQAAKPSLIKASSNICRRVRPATELLTVRFLCLLGLQCVPISRAGPTTLGLKDVGLGRQIFQQLTAFPLLYIGTKKAQIVFSAQLYFLE